MATGALREGPSFPRCSTPTRSWWRRGTPADIGRKPLRKGYASEAVHLQRPLLRGYAGQWKVYLAHDFGVSAPSVTYVVGESPGTTGPDGRYYPRGSIVLLDELATNEPGSFERGMGYTVPVLAERIQGLAKRWHMTPQGCADDAIFARTGSGAGSIAEEFRSAGVYFVRARKGERVVGWERMRRMLQDAGSSDRP